MIVETTNIESTILAGDIDMVKDKLTTFAPGYKYTKLYKLKRWNGKVSLLKDTIFPTGLLQTVEPDQVLDKRSIKSITLRATTIPLHNYQYEVIEKSFKNTYKGLWWPRGVIRVATGGGKTRVAAAMIQMAQVPTLFLVHRKQLVKQTAKVFKEFDLSSSEDFDRPSKVVVTTVQSLMSWAYKRKEISASLKKKRDRVISYLDSVEQVFVDEAHLMGSTLDKGNLFSQALQLTSNAYMRWGLTATPFMREKYHNWLLEGATGPQICNISTKFLIDNGYLARPDISMVKINKKKILQSWPECYDLGVVMNDERNNLIARLISRESGPLLVLVDRIGHGKLIQRAARDHGFSIDFISGEHSVEAREEKLKELESGKVKALIASSIWDAGIDIPSISTLILAGGGNSESEAIQHLGRGLRKTPTKSTVKVYDFLDDAAPTLKRHALNRMATWREEGHEVKVLDSI